MRTWKIACSAAVVALSLTSAPRADEWNKLTLLTFSGPVEVPGITLPAGTYRFQLADPEGGRQVIRVDDKDGKKTYGMFLSLSNQKLDPSDKPVVMFAESAAGAPPAVKVWFYPGETSGYEFVYPHEQALKIAKANHERVLTMKDNSTSTTTDAERVASMKSAEVTRIDENDKTLSADAQLKESSSPVSTTTAQSKPSAPSASTTTSTTTAQSAPATPSTTTAATTTTSESRAVAPPPAPQPTTTTESTTARRTRAPEPAPATTAERVEQGAVGTSGTGSPAPAPARKHLPATGSNLPLMALLSGLALTGALGLRATRKAV